MNTRARPTARDLRSRGFSLVEVLVGLVIGIVALLVIYQVFAVSEGYKRTASSGGDAQTTGLVSTFLIAQDLVSAGSTIASSPALANCPSTGDFATTWRPIPALIRDGGAPEVSDRIDVFYGASPILVTPLPLRTSTPAGGLMQVQSPMGFRAGDLVVVAGRQFPAPPPPLPVPFNCEVVRVNAVNPIGGGFVELTPAVGLATGYNQNSDLVNLGQDPNLAPAPQNPVRKTRYDIAGDVLRSLDLLTAGAVPNPIASNVVLMKAQYGLDTNGDRFIDTWTSALDGGPAGNWGHDAVLAAPIGQLRQIKAIRIAMIVRSAQFERTRDAEGNVTAPQLGVDFTTTLFACNGAIPCTGELAGVTLPGSANYRHRVFEQVIPLRSQIWNP